MSKCELCEREEPCEKCDREDCPQQDDNDFPLGKACDLSGEGTCEACQ